MSEQGKPKVSEHPVAARQIARARAWGALIGFVLVYWLSRRAGLLFPESGGHGVLGDVGLALLAHVPLAISRRPRRSRSNSATMA